MTKFDGNGQRKTLLSKDLILDFISELDSVKLSFDGEQVSLDHLVRCDKCCGFSKMHLGFYN